MNRLSVEELAALVGQTVRLQKRADRWWGLCPFHPEKTPSFYVWEGREGQGRFHCRGCGADGDGGDWLKFIGNPGAAKSYKPDPAIERRRQEQRQREERRQLLLDVYPELPPEAEEFVDDGDSLTLLQLRLRGKLARARR